MDKNKKRKNNILHILIFTSNKMSNSHKNKMTNKTATNKITNKITTTINILVQQQEYSLYQEQLLYLIQVPHKTLLPIHPLKFNKHKFSRHLSKILNLIYKSNKNKLDNNKLDSNKFKDGTKMLMIILHYKFQAYCENLFNFKIRNNNL